MVSRLKEEGAVVVGCVARVQQDAGDEEPAKNEEQLNADPASMQSRNEQVGDAAECEHQIEVVWNDEKNRDRPKAIEDGQARRRRIRGGHECRLDATGYRISHSRAES